MTQQQLERAKLVQLQIMDEIHRLCEENGITYYLIAGTLLGAVRHKGFIPWDVDIDIGMSRENYERFKEVCQSQLSENYRYCDHLNMKHYMRPHALVCDLKSKVIAKYDPVNPVSEDHGLYIDVFPLDNAPDDEILRARQAKKLKRINRFKKYRIPYSYSYKRWKRWAHYCISALLCWIPVKAINCRQQKLMQKYSGETTQCLCSMASQYAYHKQCMPAGIYGKPVLLEFEGRAYYAPEQYREYLTRLYGDYNKLPPEEKRQANLELHHSIEFWD